jgi:site-specific DNA-adenine methylase
LIQVYLALRDRPVEFIESCRKIRPLEPGESPERLKAIFHQFAADISIDTALRFYFLQRTTWGGIVDRVYNKPSFQCAKGWRIIQGDRLWQAAGRLRGTTITAGVYLPLLQAPGNDVWIYCDPCYYVNNELAEGRWLYRHIFTEQQHVEFARHVRACSHKVLISYDDHPFIRSLYSGLTIYHADPLRYQLNGKKGRELFIANY